MNRANIIMIEASLDNKIEYLNNLCQMGLREIEQAYTSDQLESFRVKFLGAKGLLKESMSLLCCETEEQKKLFVQTLFDVKDKLSETWSKKYEEIK